MTLKQMMERRGQLAERVKELSDTIIAAERDFTAQEKIEWDETNQEYDALVSQIETVERAQGLIDECNEPAPNPFDRQNYDPRTANSRDSGAASDPVTRSKWKDDVGRPVVTFRHNESMAKAVGGPRSDEIPGVGESLRALALGLEGRNSPQSIGLPAQGGYMLQPVQSARLIDLMRAQSVLSQAGAETLGMDSNELTIARAADDAEFSWVGETEEIPASDMSFGRLSLRARKLSTIVHVSRELLEDAVNAAQMIEGMLSRAMAVKLDGTGLTGSGEGEEPLGVLNTEGILEEAVGGTIHYDDILDAMTKLENENVSPNAVVFHPDAYGTLRKLKESSTDGYLAPPQVWNDLQRLSTTNLDNADGVLGRFSDLIIAVRQNITIETSAHVEFAKDMISFRISWRGDVGLARPKSFCHLSGITY